MKLTIDYNVWLRGEGNLVSYLLRNSDNRRCCVGIYLAALRVPKSRLLNLSDAQDVNDLPMAANWLLVSARIGRLYAVNDDEKISDQQRETKVAAIFRKNGVTVNFVNGPKPRTQNSGNKRCEEGST